MIKKSMYFQCFFTLGFFLFFGAGILGCDNRQREIERGRGSGYFVLENYVIFEILMIFIFKYQKLNYEWF